ncbi:4351_t:CDS:10, partial [Diversispora eburnea]
FDSYKLDISIEFKLAIHLLRGHEKVRILFNKADMVDRQQLMCVLLIEAEQKDLLNNLRDLPCNATIRKINNIVKRVRLAKVHAYIIGHLKKEMPAMFVNYTTIQLMNKLFSNRFHFPDQPPNEDNQESSGYKFQREYNGDVSIIDISYPEHGLVAGLLQRYFNAPSNNIIVYPSIIFGIDEFHDSPSETGELIAADVSVYTNANNVQHPRIPYSGPPPGNKTGWPHLRIACEVGILQSTEKWTTNSGASGVNIPIAQVFWDPALPLSPAAEYVPDVPAPLVNGPVNFTIDLYQVQQLVLCEQDNT